MFEDNGTTKPEIQGQINEWVQDHQKTLRLVFNVLIRQIFNFRWLIGKFLQNC